MEAIYNCPNGDCWKNKGTISRFGLYTSPIDIDAQLSP
jgi:hypothetical protein